MSSARPGAGRCGPSGTPGTADWLFTRGDDGDGRKKLYCTVLTVHRWGETQANLPKCQTSYIESVIQGTGIAAAYCNDRYFVLISDASAGGLFEYNLNDIPQPPGGTQPADAADGSFSAGEACVTGMDSLTAGKVVRPHTQMLLPHAPADHTRNFLL
jgi:hypothetical protein